MTKEDFKDLDNALALLHDYISNYGAKEEHYKILNSAESVVQYFLANAGTWRGDDAKRIKAELKSML